MAVAVAVAGAAAAVVVVVVVGVGVGVGVGGLPAEVAATCIQKSRGKCSTLGWNLRNFFGLESSRAWVCKNATGLLVMGSILLHRRAPHLPNFNP